MNIDIHSKEYKEQLEYFNNNYGAEFRPGQGTEEILDMINSFSQPGCLIDFGSGSNIYFWLLAMNGIYDITCVDISSEAFYINEQIRNKVLLPKSFSIVCRKYNTNIEELFKIKPQYIIQNIFEDTLPIKDKYNNVSQFGLLGLSRSKAEYKKHFYQLWNYLEPDGVFIGANWIFSDIYSRLKGFSNRYLNCEIIEEISRECQADLLDNRLVTIRNDVNYTHVLMYALVKKNG